MHVDEGMAPVVRCVARGHYGSVWLSESACEELQKLNARTDKLGIQEAKTIERHFRRFAELGPSRLDNNKMFKSLGKHKDGTGGRVHLFEFKAFQWRLYGVLRNFRGGRAFLGIEVDPDKKKDKADQALLARCAKASSVFE